MRITRKIATFPKRYTPPLMLEAPHVDSGLALTYIEKPIDSDQVNVSIFEFQMDETAGDTDYLLIDRLSGLRITVSNFDALIVDAIHIENKVTYDGNNLIGLTLSDVMQIFKSQIISLDGPFQIGDQEQKTVSIDQMGAMFWIDKCKRVCSMDIWGKDRAV